MEVNSDYTMCVASTMTQHILCCSNEPLFCHCDNRNAGLALRCIPQCMQ